MRRQKADDKDLFDTSSSSVDDHSGEFNDIPDMPPLQKKEKDLKKGKSKRREGLKTLTPNKLLSRLSTLLAQIKAGNNSYELKNEIRQVLYLLYQ